MAEALRQADRPPGTRVRDARPGRRQRGHRHPHGGAGFHADDRLRRPGRRRHGRPRSVPGDRLPPDVRQRRQMGGADRPRGTHPRIPGACVPGRDVRPARARRAGASRGHAYRARRCADAPRVDAVATAPDAGQIAAARALLQRSATPGDRRRQPLGCRRLRRVAALRGERRVAGGLRVSQPGSVRQPPSELCRRCGNRHQSQARRARARCRRAARDRRAAGRDDDVGLHAARRAHAVAVADPRASGRRRTRPRLSAGAGHQRHARRVPRGDGGATVAGSRRPARAPDAARARTTTPGGRRAPVPGDVDMWQVAQWLDAHLPDDAIVTNGAGNYSTWMHRLFRYRGFRTQLAPYSGAMGYGVPAAVAAKAAAPGPRRRLMERRRLLPHERTGTGHGRPVRPGGDLRGHRQRHVRDDPDAPGEDLPRPRFGHGPAQSGFRGVGASLRRRRRDRRAHRRVRAGVPARAAASGPR